MASKDDPLILPDMRLRAAIALALSTLETCARTCETFISPIPFTAPKTVEGALAALLELGERLAKGEIYDGGAW